MTILIIMYPTLLQHTVENVIDDEILIELKLKILSHLTILSQSINNDFPEEKFEQVKKHLWKKSVCFTKSRINN